MEAEDNKLIARYLSGDNNALALLIERNLKLVYRFAYRLSRDVYDAEDITQETFVKMWRSAHRFDNEKNFRTWLFSIAHNTAIDLLRKKKSLVFSDFDTGEGSSIMDTLADIEPLPDELFMRAEEKKLLDVALGKLSALHREVLLLHHEDDLTFNEIGTILGKPLNTVKSQYRRAIFALRKILEEAA